MQRRWWTRKIIWDTLRVGFSKRKTIRGIDQRVHLSTSARACRGAFFDERDAANGVEGASLIFQLYLHHIASSGVSFLKHQRHFAHREATTVSARSSAPSRPLRDYARLIEGNAPKTARFQFVNYPRNTRKRRDGRDVDSGANYTASLRPATFRARRSNFELLI